MGPRGGPVNTDIYLQLVTTSLETERDDYKVHFTEGVKLINEILKILLCIEFGYQLEALLYHAKDSCFQCQTVGKRSLFRLQKQTILALKLLDHAQRAPKFYQLNHSEKHM